MVVCAVIVDVSFVCLKSKKKKEKKNTRTFQSIFTFFYSNPNHTLLMVMTELDLIWGDKPRVGPAYTEALHVRHVYMPAHSEQRKNPL